MASWEIFEKMDVLIGFNGTIEFHQSERHDAETFPASVMLKQYPNRYTDYCKWEKINSLIF
jgi:hypothetical protein